MNPLTPEQQVRFNLLCQFVQKGAELPETTRLDALVRWVFQGSQIMPVSTFQVVPK